MTAIRTVAPKAPRTFYLWHGRDGRYVMHGHELHCGDCFEAEIDGVWVQTRIEHSQSSTHSHGWYLVTHPEQPLDDLPVRKEGL